MCVEQLFSGSVCPTLSWVQSIPQSRGIWGLGVLLAEQGPEFLQVQKKPGPGHCSFHLVPWGELASWGLCRCQGVASSALCFLSSSSGDQSPSTLVLVVDVARPRAQDTPLVTLCLCFWQEKALLWFFSAITGRIVPGRWHRGARLVWVAL